MQHELESNEPPVLEQKRLEDVERRDDLIAYFDIAWEIFVRLEREGKLGISPLTISKVNPTVKPPTAQSEDQPNETA